MEDGADTMAIRKIEVKTNSRKLEHMLVSLLESLFKEFSIESEIVIHVNGKPAEILKFSKKV